MADIKDEVIALIWKTITGFSTYVLIAVLSVLGMLGNNMYLGKKLGFWQGVGLATVALSVGGTTGVICYSYGLEKAGYIITAIATYASDKIVLSIMAIDWSKSVKEAVRDWLKSLANKIK